MKLQGDLEVEIARVWAGQNDGAHDIWHLRRVWANCSRIADQLDRDVDRDVLLIASYLHDIVNLPKDDARRKDAADLSAQHAIAWMTQRALPDAQAVAYAIRAHSYSANAPCQTLEAQILQDADRLEALGAIGIARCFNVAGQMGAGLVHGGDPLAQARALDDRAYALDHFETKLFGIAKTLNTAPAQQMATQRVEVMRAFVAQLVDEATV